MATPLTWRQRGSSIGHWTKEQNATRTVGEIVTLGEQLQEDNGRRSAFTAGRGPVPEREHGHTRIEALTQRSFLKSRIGHEDYFLLAHLLRNSDGPRSNDFIKPLHEPLVSEVIAVAWSHASRHTRPHEP